jgi:ribonuclease R
MSGDRVVIQVKRKSDKTGEVRLTGRVVKVLERAHTRVAGTLRQAQGQWQVLPDGGDFCRPILIDKVDTREVRAGDKVVVLLRSYPTRSEPARGVITEVLGLTGHCGAEISAIMQRYGLEEYFTPSSLVEANNARSAFRPEDAQDREDLTDHLIITIDPPDAQDYDDAISLTRTKKGFWELGVHIADVSYFVPRGSSLDHEARKRGNTVYLPGHTLPMLPEILSTGLCSLQPDTVRYTKSVFLTYHKDGTLVATRLANSTIRSSARLTYEQADQAIRGRRSDVAEPVVTLLQDMDALARLFEDKRRRAGMLQLPMPETRVILDDTGRVTGVEPEDTSYTHTIIEMFMVEANIAVAHLLDRHCIPFIRRIHPAPNIKALRRLSQTLRLLGVNLSRQPRRVQLQALLDRLRDSNLAVPVHILVLRSLAKAIYSPASEGHYALAASKYCHFTSPIRRYADLMVHRVLDAYLRGQVAQARRLYGFAELADLGVHLTETEQAADEAEHEVKTILVLTLLEHRIGEELDGLVVGLSPFGASVHLPDYGIEGLIRRESLGPDIWKFDERTQCLVGRHTGAVVRLAQPIRVRIAEVHAAAGQLDLAPATELIVRMKRQPVTTKQTRHVKVTKKKAPRKRKM